MKRTRGRVREDEIKRKTEKGKHVRKCELKGRPNIWDNEIVGHEMLDEVRKKLRPN